MEKWFMAIQKNSEGRPCGWGTSQDEGKAIAEAARQYRQHSCYAGEESGELQVKEFDYEPYFNRHPLSTKE
jgi:hypothetical protein